ncbi:MAG: FAD-dependent oxidoreductase [Neisseria sp.]|nr:FAD-dependent oxidoreductase [Neisseria sp.]
MQNLHAKNLVIGFGKAGKTLAADLAKHGEEVILAETSAEMYGGTCINIGCIPSKKLLVEGHDRALCQHQGAAVFDAAMTAKNDLVAKLRAANFHKVDDLAGARVITAEARFEDEHTVLLSGRDGEYRVSAERIFINTGSLPAKLDIEGADGERVYDSTGLLALAARPERLVIIGGGYIGLEFAFMFQAFGSEVTILDSSDTFLPREDRDIAEEMLHIMQSKGIRVVQTAHALSIKHHSHSSTVHTDQGEFEAEAVLVAIGRRPNTASLALENAGIALSERGFIQTDDKLRVKNHIWAMGDVAGSPQFTFISLDDYRIVRSQLLGDGKRSTADRAVFPTCVFTEPPLAQIGLTESRARSKGLNIRVAAFKAADIPKAKVLRQTDGLLKAVVDADSSKILGVTLFCAEAHELINLFKMAMDNGIGAEYLKNQIFTHPSMAEGLNDLFVGF